MILRYLTETTLLFVLWCNGTFNIVLTEIIIKQSINDAITPKYETKLSVYVAAASSFWRQSPQLTTGLPEVVFSTNHLAIETTN